MRAWAEGLPRWQMLVICVSASSLGWLLLQVSKAAEPVGLRIALLLLSFGPPLVGIYITVRWVLAPGRNSSAGDTPS